MSAGVYKRLFACKRTNVGQISINQQERETSEPSTKTLNVPSLFFRGGELTQLKKTTAAVPQEQIVSALYLATVRTQPPRGGTSNNRHSVANDGFPT